MAQEAEQALKSNGESLINLTVNYNVEFIEGRVKKNGRWIKTGKIYWIYTTYREGKRRRISPTAVHGKQRFLTSIDNCPHQGRIEEYFRNRKDAAISSDGSNSNGYSDSAGGFQSIEGTIFDKQAGRE
jgi:hypothetical protein